jgi:hypothetical protein
MIRLLIKLALAALIANAVYRVGSEYVTHLKFREAVRDTILYKSTSDEDLRRKIAVIADEYDVPLKPEAVEIRHIDQQVLVNGSYERRMELLPRVEVPWPFSWSIDVVMPSTLLPGAPPR